MTATTRQNRAIYRFCSKIGTAFPFRFCICWSCWRSWDLYNFSRKILALSLFILISTALTPLFVHSQAPTSATLSVRIDDMQSRLNRLDSVPTDLAEVKTRLQAIED